MRRSTRLPKTFWYLWSGLLINQLGGFGIIFLSLYLVKARGLDSTGAGLVVGCYGVGGCAGVLAAGVLADRWGRRKTLILSHAGTTVALLALAFVPWVPVIAVVTAIVGATQRMVGPPLVAAMVDVVPPPDRTRAFSLEFWAFNLGTAVAAPLAGLLAGVGFTPLFLVEAAATAVTLLILILKVPETLPPRQEGDDETKGLGAVLTDRVWMTFISLTLVLATLSTMTMTILPLAMAQDHLRPSAYGLVTGASGLLIVAGQLLMPRLVGRRPDPAVLAVANLFLAAGIALVGGSDILPMYFLAVGVQTVGQMLGASANATTIADLATPPLRARYQAVFYLAYPIAGFGAPALGGWSLQRFGSWTWPVFGVLGALAALGHWLAGPSRQRRVAALREAAEAAPRSLNACA